MGQGEQMAEYQTYTVKSGDILSKIARKNDTTVGEQRARTGPESNGTAVNSSSVITFTALE